jgi:hypothetical protein
MSTVACGRRRDRRLKTNSEFEFGRPCQSVARIGKSPVENSIRSLFT